MSPVFRVAGLGAEAVEYVAAWDLQREVHAAVAAGESPDSVLLLEHPPVFTAGKRTDPHERPADPGGAPVIDVDRGGKITFHGPGQLVGYPIVTLPDHVKVVDYVRRVEEALIGVCRDFGVTSEPTKAIKAVAAGRSYAISYGGLQDLQYIGDVAATFVRALTAPFEGAEAFNVRGAVEPIERFVAALRAVAPEAAGPSASSSMYR